MPVIPTLREVEADAYGPLWLHCEFKVSLGYNEISKNGGRGGIEIIIATYTKASHGVIQCLIFCCHLLPWVEKRVLSQLLPGNGLHSEQRNQAPYVGGTERESLSEVQLIGQKEGGSFCFRIQMAAHRSGLLGHLFCSGGHRCIPESLARDWRGIQLVCIPRSQKG